MSAGGAVGIDLGSHHTLVATVKSGGVEVLTNDLSNRSTPVIVSFGEKERFIGEAGFSKLNANFRNTVACSPRFLGLSPQYERLMDETKWLTCKTVAEGTKIGFEVRYQGETRVFTPEKLVAMYLTGVKLICAKEGVAMSDVVISVPSYYTEVERRALLDAAAIADISCVKIMNEVTASALTYGLFRQKELTDEARNVAIVDFGHSKISVAVVAFTKEKLQVLSHTFDRHLGGRDFDWTLMEHFASEFQAKHKINPLLNPRSRLKLANATEKLRKMLSGNADAHIAVDCLCEDYDFSSAITREKMEQLCEPLLARIQGACEEALRKSGLERIHSVELTGGASRIPSVQARLVSAFRLESVSKTMNAEEAVSKGCAVQAAMLSAFFKVKEYGISDRTAYPINISVAYLNSGDEEMNAETLFTEGNLFPMSKILTLSKNRPFQMNLFYPLQMPEGLPSNIATYTINGPTAEEEYKLKVAIKMNGHGIVNLEYAEKIDTVLVEDPPAEPPKAEEAKADAVPPASDQASATPAEPAEAAKPEAKKEPKKKTTKTPLPTDKQQLGLPEAEVARAKDQERRMRDEDKIARETLDRKNELEAMVYAWRDRVTGSHRDYLPASQAEELLSMLAHTEEWIYGDGSDTLKSIYIEQIQKVKAVVDPIQRRFTVFQQIPETVEGLRKTIAETRELAVSAHDKYSHIAQEDRQKILDQCGVTELWVEEQIPKIKNAPRHANCPVDPEDLVKKGIQIRELSSSIMNKPKPAPPKEEKKEEAKKPEEPPADKKMDTEEKPAEESKETEDMEVDA